MQITLSVSEILLENASFYLRSLDIQGRFSGQPAALRICILSSPLPLFRRKSYISSNASSPFFTVSCESPCFTNCIVTKEAAVKAAA